MKKFSEANLEIENSELFSLVKKKLLFWLDKKTRKEKIKLLNYAYSFSKISFNHIKRDSWEPYFRHLERTALIILNEFSNPTIDKVILALIHDILEDTMVNPQTIEMLFSKKILDKLIILSKRVARDESWYMKYPNKYWRNKDYFEKLLNCKDEVVIDVKLADRIDNLRTIWVWPKEKIKKKIAETRKYILPLAEKYNLKAKELLLKEIVKLEQTLNLSS
jgi:(p)ppGpp synthase/HD superfamily hydrolase